MSDYWQGIQVIYRGKNNPKKTPGNATLLKTDFLISLAYWWFVTPFDGLIHFLHLICLWLNYAYYAAVSCKFSQDATRLCAGHDALRKFSYTVSYILYWFIILSPRASHWWRLAALFRGRHAEGIDPSHWPTREIPKEVGATEMCKMTVSCRYLM